MNKIRLDLDTLAVVSFDTTGRAAGERGTVHAHLPIETQGRECDSIDVCTYWYCQTEPSGCGTCYATECGTCYDASCGATYCGTCQTDCGTCDPCCCGGCDTVCCC